MFKTDGQLTASIEQKLKDRFGDGLISSELLVDMPTFTVHQEFIISILKYLYDDDLLQFRFLTTLCGMHFIEPSEKLGVVYHLHSLKHNLRIRLKTYLPMDNPEIQSATSVFAAANWMERETYDFFGIIFRDHPNLKRILNEDDMTVFPMRKDFPLEDQTREDKNDSMFGR
ncbi:MAG: NADH-quinone oxidoreductase subunit C [Bacteroidia bacterium]|nr:NADH-quinone oxidoreductase subunit C [Bacteroidia bacterium]